MIKNQNHKMTGAADHHGDYFEIGAHIDCTTCIGEHIRGEVVAFDVLTKMLVLSKLMKIERIFISHEF